MNQPILTDEEIIEHKNFLKSKVDIARQRRSEAFAANSSLAWENKLWGEAYSDALGHFEWLIRRSASRRTEAEAGSTRTAAATDADNDQKA